ncbi:2876_t:CDS:2 [Funneliformis geosporum]|nr:2876_t:CDS:2 [Funneliformis geosporum]
MDFNFAKFYHQQKLSNTEASDEDIAKLYILHQAMEKESLSPAKVAPKHHPKYEDMIRERKGSSRQAIKKYILKTYKLPDNSTTNNRFRLAINKGVEKGSFYFPNGPSGTVKIVKKIQIKEEKGEPEKIKSPSSFQNGRSDTIKIAKKVHIKKEREEPEKTETPSSFQNGRSDTIKIAKKVHIKKEKEEPEKTETPSSLYNGPSAPIKIIKKSKD